MYIFDHLDYYWVGVPSIIIATMLILYAQVLVKRYFGNETIKKCHEVGGNYLAMVGTFYAVLLGLIVIDAMTKFQQAEKTVAIEASALIKIYTYAERFPEQKDKLEKLIEEYIQEITEVEFPLMEKGETDTKAKDLAFSMLQTVKVIDPVTDNQKAIYPNLLTLLSDFLDSRRERTRSTNFGEPAVEWIILIIGAVITITYTFFFTIDSDAIHLLMRGMATLMILMSLYLILLFGTPFSGDLKVSPEPFNRVNQLGMYYKNRTPSISHEKENLSPAETTFEQKNNDMTKSKQRTHHLR
jgi:Protein of unknown function (DUF4239)